MKRPLRGGLFALHPIEGSDNSPLSIFEERDIARARDMILFEFTRRSNIDDPTMSCQIVQIDLLDTVLVGVKMNHERIWGI
mgnify:CR=1 FL=1